MSSSTGLPTALQLRKESYLLNSEKLQRKSHKFTLLNHFDFRSTLDALYGEAEERWRSTPQSDRDYLMSTIPRNVPQAPISSSYNPNGLLSQQVRQSLPTPRVQVPYSNPGMTASPANFSRTDSYSTVDSYKRQKTCEGPDFTSSYLPHTKQAAINPNKIVEEDKSEVELVNELKSGNKPDSLGLPPRFQGLKTVSAAIVTNYAEQLKEKEKEIKSLEFEEETKAVRSDISSQAIEVQKSVYKDNRPLFEDSSKTKHIKCYCGDSYA